MKHLGTSEEDFPVVEYQKDNYRINGEEPDTKLYNLAIQSTDFLYPLNISLDMNISLDTAIRPYRIVNQKEILSRWRKTEEETNNRFTDAYSKKYIGKMNQVLDEGLHKYIMRDVFLQFYFVPYVKYLDGKSSTKYRFHNYRILYQNTMEIKAVQDEIIITQTADCIDSRTQQQILDYWYPEDDEKEETNCSLESAIFGEYILNKQTKIIQSAKIQINTLFYGEYENMEITIDRI